MKRQSKTWCVRVSKYRYLKDESGNTLPPCPENWDKTTEVNVDLLVDALRKRFERVRYCFEIGDETGMPHWHFLLQNAAKAVRFDSVKSIVHYGKIESWRVGAPLDNYLNYMDEDGEVYGDPREVFEEPPEAKEGYSGAGSRTDWAIVREMFADGLGIDEVIATYPHLSLNVGALEKLRSTIVGAKWARCLRKDIEVTYIYGEAGTGKSRFVLETEGLGNVFRVTDYRHPFDGYECQPAICFEEFRNSLPFEQMLNYLDIYPCELPSRYANKHACYTRVYIVSNWAYDEQYKTIRETHADSIAAWDRRVHKIIKMGAGGVQTLIRSRQTERLQLSFLGEVDESGALPY
ncbi:MAG: hypothetical protein J6Q89_04640 [Clostridia bacterium]|nr:hypothetical protein [Clostridia bacterium]